MLKALYSLPRPASLATPEQVASVTTGPEVGGYVAQPEGSAQDGAAEPERADQAR